MALMTTEQQGDILTAINDPSLTFAAGGSAANTMVAITQSGGSGVYTGRVADDTNGCLLYTSVAADKLFRFVCVTENDVAVFANNVFELVCKKVHQERI